MDGNRIFSGGVDSNIKEWDLRTGKVVTNLALHKKAVSSLHWNPNTGILTSGKYCNRDLLDM
jgi:autophagy-related protein 16